jgi:myo-inositol 2-dehydrogenase / D-chiro-inositol 1-dehydrogenase
MSLVVWDPHQFPISLLPSLLLEYPAKMSVQRLKVGIAGLGRMGKRHAVNFLHRAPRAEVVAAFTPDETELAWARTNLEPYGVTLYTDYNQMINHEGIQAVVVATATKVHAEETLAAIAKDLHVLCEKPISLNIDTVSLHISSCNLCIPAVD